MSETLCWTCQKGPHSGCPWFAEHKPVSGWKAERRDVLMRVGKQGGARERTYSESYIVYECPLYQTDQPVAETPKQEGPYYDAPVCMDCYSRKICMEHHCTCNQRTKL